MSLAEALFRASMRSYLLTFVAAMVLGFVLTPVAIRAGRRLRMLDATADPPIPRSGGLAIVAAAALALLALAAAFAPARFILRQGLAQLEPVLWAGGALLILGIVDDIKRLTATPKFAVEILLATALFLFGGVRASTLWLPLGIVDLGPVLGLLLTVAWIVGVTNAFNLLDGIDGAAGGAAVFALLAMFVTSVVLGQPLVALLAVAIAGATLGFLPYNFAPARIYLGDTGSLFLGFMLATLALEGSQKGPAIVALAIPLVAFGLPVLDTGVAVVRRALRGAPIFKGDREHVHHRLLDLGLSPAQAAVTVYAVSAAFALASMLFINPNVRGMAVVLTMVGVAAWLAVRYLRFHEFAELARLARRGMTQTRAIAFNVELRKAAVALQSAASWDEFTGTLARAFAESEFDGVRLTLQAAAAKSPRRDFELEDGVFREHARAAAADEWGVHIPFQLGRSGRMHAELAVFRRYGRRPLLADLNLLIETLRPAMEAAAARLEAPGT
jgi:UDP-GlcNAc:undecaprenyl-phosphate GlcNAc-1-phosphate transferase